MLNALSKVLLQLNKYFVISPRAAAALLAIDYRIFLNFYESLILRVRPYAFLMDEKMGKSKTYEYCHGT